MPGTGIGWLSSRHQECSSRLQGIAKQPGGYQSLLICTQTWWFSCARKQTQISWSKKSCQVQGTSSEIGTFLHSTTSSFQSTTCSLGWADVDLALISMSFCKGMISFSTAELSESKRYLTLVAMSPASTQEHQFCLLNKSHESIKLTETSQDIPFSILISGVSC